jgi:WD40 repeat protein
MRLRKSFRLLSVSLCLVGKIWAGLAGINYDPNLGQNQVRLVNPVTGSTTLLNTFTFSSGGWNGETFSVNSQSALLYAQSGDQTVYTFDAKSGHILNSVVADTGMSAMDIGLGSNLIGISYDPVSMENEIRAVDPSTGHTTLLNTFAFSSGGFFPGTLASVPSLNRFYVQSGDGTVYTFDLTTGQILNARLADTTMQALSYWKAGELIGIDYNPGTMQNEVRILDPSTGTTTLLSSLAFSSGGWIDTTFAVDSLGNVFYAESGDGTLYTFDLGTGAILGSQSLDTTMQTLGVVANTPVPEPSTIWAVALLGPVIWRRVRVAARSMQ